MGVFPFQDAGAMLIYHWDHKTVHGNHSDFYERRKMRREEDEEEEEEV